MVSVLASVFHRLHFQETKEDPKEASRSYFRCLSKMEDSAHRLALYRAQTGHYPEKLTADFYADAVEAGSLGYKLSPDGQRWTLYCPGSHHKALGLGANLPRMNSDGDLVGLPENSR